MSNDIHSSSNLPPNHVIIWLDINIGKREDYNQLKAAFSSTTNPECVNPIRLIDKDDEEINRTVGFEQVKFEGVDFLLAAFTNVERCVEFLRQNQDKRFFFITSGQIGRVVVPLIKEKCENIFTHPATKEHYSPFYVFCHSIQRNQDWMEDCVDYVRSAFTFDADLLVRLIRDIADYFVAESKRLMKGNPPDKSAAYCRLNWAHELYQRYRELEKDPLKQEFNEVNALLEPLEIAMKESSDY